jgi:hypothetical protein
MVTRLEMVPKKALSSGLNITKTATNTVTGDTGTFGTSARHPACKARE